VDTIDLKLELYKCLVSVPPKMLSNSEVEIMYALSSDPEVQTHLEKNKKENLKGGKFNG
jgi:hypothetical protein